MRGGTSYGERQFLLSIAVRANLTTKIEHAGGLGHVGVRTFGAQLGRLVEFARVIFSFRREKVHIVTALPFEHDSGVHFYALVLLFCLHVKFPIDGLCCLCSMNVSVLVHLYIKN